MTAHWHKDYSVPGIRKNGKPCYKPLEILCKHHASVPARSRAGTASQGVYGARATLRGLPRSCPTSRLFRDDIYRALLESMAEKGRPWFGPIYSEEEVQSRRCAPRPANHGDGPQARPAAHWPGNLCAESPVGTGAPRKPIPAAQTESAAPRLLRCGSSRGRGSSPAHHGAFVGGLSDS